MKITLKFLFLLLLTTASFGQANDKNNVVWERALALNKAIFETKDSAAIQDLVAANVTYGHSGGNIEDKPVMIRGAVSNVEVYNNISVEKLSVGNAGNTVIVRYILRAEGVKNGVTNPLNLSILQVWAKDKGKWVLFARQAVKINPK